MGRASSSSAYQRACQAWSLRDSGMTNAGIARELGVSRAAITKIFLKPDPRFQPSPELIIEKARVLKASDPDLGAIQIRAILADSLGSDEFVMSERSITTAISDLVVQRQTCKNPRSCFQHDHPTEPLNTFEFDTKTLIYEDQRFEVLTCTDIVTHTAWSELLTGRASVAWGLSRCFEALGVPKILQSDNGFGWHNPRRDLLSNAAKFAFSRGVERFHFVPPGEAWRNGHVERFNKSLGLAWASAKRRGHGSHDLEEWLRDWLLYYNTVKPHTRLGGVSGRLAPAAVGQYNHLDLPASSSDYRDPRVIFDFKRNGGTVSYHRLVSSGGILAIGSPLMLFKLPTFGHYARVDLDTRTGRGEIWADRKCVAQFHHALGGHFEDAGDCPVLTFTGEAARSYRVDDEETEKFLSRRLRHGKAGYIVPKPYALLDGQVVDTRTGEIVFDNQQCIFGIDHLEEFLHVA